MSRRGSALVIASYEAVKTIINQPHYVVRREIDAFFKERTRGELLLLYFSGHGVKVEWLCTASC